MHGRCGQWLRRYGFRVAYGVYGIATLLALLTGAWLQAGVNVGLAVTVALTKRLLEDHPD